MLLPYRLWNQASQQIRFLRRNKSQHCAWNNTLITNPCSCLSSTGACNQDSQWFNFADPNEVVEASQAIGSGQPVGLGVLCPQSYSTWELITNSKEQFSTRISTGSTLCLDLDPNNLIITNPCAQDAEVIFSPLTRLCAVRKVEPASTLKLQLGSCSQAEQWAYTPEKLLLDKEKSWCLQAVGSGQPVGLGVLCPQSYSTWQLITNKSRVQFSTRISTGSTLCLDLDPNNILITNPCSQRDGQWFTLN
ncbi:hypothetical protein Cni_G24362 [Canna indica]|uniref:Ricin B lectin domain-containing protein n=1 Tax=Canna indica TaxID=4628 RepID=A0AAQ3L007_9LILI|nr:hypothetical protein Cni_G24362 [Canna indica]